MNAIKDEYEIDLEKERRTYVRPMKETANIKRMYEILPDLMSNRFIFYYLVIIIIEKFSFIL